MKKRIHYILLICFTPLLVYTQSIEINYFGGGKILSPFHIGYPSLCDSLSKKKPIESNFAIYECLSDSSFKSFSSSVILLLAQIEQDTNNYDLNVLIIDIELPNSTGCTIKTIIANSHTQIKWFSKQMKLLFREYGLLNIESNWKYYERMWSH
jgi:hypothetical protein